MKDKTIAEYKILPDMNLVLQVYKGPVTLGIIKQVKKEIYQQLTYKTSFNFIVDIRDVEVILTRDDLINYGNFVAEESDPNDRVKVALLSRTPEQLAATMIVQLNEKGNSIEHKAFNNLKACLAWVGIPNTKFNTMALEATLSTMKQEPVKD